MERSSGQQNYAERYIDEERNMILIIWLSILTSVFLGIGIHCFIEFYRDNCPGFIGFILFLLGLICPGIALWIFIEIIRVSIPYILEG